MYVDKNNNERRNINKDPTLSEPSTDLLWFFFAATVNCGFALQHMNMTS